MTDMQCVFCPSYITSDTWKMQYHAEMHTRESSERSLRMFLGGVMAFFKPVEEVEVE